MGKATQIKLPHKGVQHGKIKRY